MGGISANRSSDNTVFLLSSTAQPYQRDALDLVFLPSNTSYRFRYDKKWLSSDFKLDDGRISKTKVYDLKGKEAILVHILIEHEKGIENEQMDYRVLEYLPIRKATINQVKVLGDFLWVGFILGDWITYEQQTEESENEYNEFLRKQFKKENSDRLGELVFVRRRPKINTISERCGDTEDKVLSNWNSIASHVSRFASKYDSSEKFPVMLKLIDVRDVDGEKIVWPKKIGQELYGFELASGKSYFFDVAEYCIQGIEPFEIRLKTEEKVITPTMSTVEVKGKYDILRFMVNCNFTDRDQLSMVCFEPISLQARGISKAFIWTKVKSRKWKDLGLPLIGFGFFTFIASTQFYNLITFKVVDYSILLTGAIGAIGSTISLRLLKK